jgi:hypothetical protein
VASRDEADGDGEDDERGEGEADTAEEAPAPGLPLGLFGGEGFVGNYFGVREMGEVHGLIAV